MAKIYYKEAGKSYQRKKTTVQPYIALKRIIFALAACNILQLLLRVWHA